MPYGNSTRYLVRAEPGRRDEVMKMVEQKLAEANPSRIIGKIRPIEEVRKEAYSDDRSMAIILGTVIFCLLTITALGIVGMASFWVAQRTKQIGTRRALGATKRDILRYFQTENFIITTMGSDCGRHPRVRVQPVADAHVPVAAAAVVLRAARLPEPVAAGPARRARARAARIARAAGGGDAQRLRRTILRARNREFRALSKVPHRSECPRAPARFARRLALVRFRRYAETHESNLLPTSRI